jgi:predicted transcriptional regulator
MPSPRCYPHRLAVDVLSALATMATTTPGLEELAGELGLARPAVAAEVRKLERSGLVETWPDPANPGSRRLLLSARSAVRLGVRLSARGDRWEPAGAGGPPGGAAMHLFTQEVG